MRWLSLLVLWFAATCFAVDKMAPPMAEDDPQPGRRLVGYVFAGALAWNPSYAASPDNTGRALLRYGTHVELDLVRPWLSLNVDLNLFSDRYSRYGVGPTELDSVVSLVLHWRQFDLAVVGENDQALNLKAYQQSYISVIASWKFKYVWSRR